MENSREVLLEAYEKISKLSLECSLNVKKTCAGSELTVRQIEYLKIIDKYDNMTFSRLAELTNNSKPTITEMINRFVALNMVYKERSSTDGRISYIHLTGQGKTIARYEHFTAQRVVDRMMDSLTEVEIETLISLFRKVK